MMVPAILLQEASSIKMQEKNQCNYFHFADVNGSSDSIRPEPRQKISSWRRWEGRKKTALHLNNLGLSGLT